MTGRVQPMSDAVRIDTRKAGLVVSHRNDRITSNPTAGMRCIQERCHAADHGMCSSPSSTPVILGDGEQCTAVISAH